jgi:hypothetical protein
MLSPRQIFEDNIRPADLLLKVCRLLEHDAPNTEKELHRALGELVKAEKDETLTVIYNEIFLGLIRERAEIPATSIKRSALCNLLRQGVVTACTALETYLPTLLRNQLPEVIKLRGREFVPKSVRPHRLSAAEHQFRALGRGTGQRTQTCFSEFRSSSRQMTYATRSAQPLSSGSPLKRTLIR